MTILKHKRCGGQLHVNTAGLFLFKSPQMNITPDGIIVGVQEMQENPNGHASFCCSKCSAEIALTDFSSIIIECCVCRKFHAVDLSKHAMFGIVCNDCADMLAGKKSPSEDVGKVMEYIYIPDGSARLTLVSEILTKKVRI